MTASRFMKQENQERRTKYRSGFSVNPVEHAGSRPVFIVSDRKGRASSLSRPKKKKAAFSNGQRLALLPVPYGFRQ